MTREHTDSDGFVDLGGHGFYVTEAEDMGGYTMRKPLRNKKIELNRETGDVTIIDEHPLDKRAQEEYYRIINEIVKERLGGC